jgi:hypothetical protein
MAETGCPYALAPLLHPDGTVLDGTRLAEAIRPIAAEISPVPSHYMIGYLYPTRLNSVAECAWVKSERFPSSAQNLDQLNRLPWADVRGWAPDEMTCARELELTILAGCCGMGERYIEALAKTAVH